MSKSGLFLLSAGLIITGLFIYACSTAPGSGSGGGTASSSSSSALVLEAGIFVATNGNDANSGTNAAEAVKTIQTAVSAAVALGFTNVYVAQGTYSPGNGLNPESNGMLITNNNISLSGGYSAGFTSRAGRSILDGTNGLYHVIRVENAMNIQIDGFIAANGSAAGSYPDNCGGGIYLNSAYNCGITNTMISNCHAQNRGGGMFLNGCTNNFISALFYGNNSSSQGGALFIFTSRSNQISSDIISNSAAANGGGIYIDSTADYNMITGNISGNSADGGYGGGIHNEGDHLLITNAVISNNTASMGGGITLYFAEECSVFAVISGNSSPNNGGGIYMFYCVSNFINSVLTGNRAMIGGGIETFGCNNTMISGVFNGNGTTNGSGGGLFVWNGFNTIVSADFTGNFAVYSKGGAVYFEASTNSVLINSVLTNNWSYTGYTYGNAVIITGQYMGSFMMSNCTIGGSLNKNYQGIYGFLEDFEMTGHLLLDNKFLTNNLDFLYCDVNGYLVVTNKADWTNINNTTFTGAAMAGGNTVE